MQSLGAHEQIRLKITAFLFNRRADALRGEMYRALCLHVLNEVDEPQSREAIVELVAYALGKDVKVTDSLRTVVLDELRRLTDEGVALCEDEHYFLHEDESMQLPDEEAQEQLYSAILEELREVAVSLNPNVSRAQLDSLLGFYIEVSNAVAQYQLGFISRGRGVQEITPDTEGISAIVSDCRKRHGVDQFIDVNEFILKSLIRPNETLSNYLYRLIQVSVVTQLLAWDPALEYLQNAILSDKTLYLDSSVLFVLMQTSDPLHHFLSSLLRASQSDLGVKLKVHEITLKEYQKVMDWADMQNSQSHRELREIARICKRDDENPADYLESSIFADYVSKNLDHIDLGSWQRYRASVTGRSLVDNLQSFLIEVDKTVIYVPDEEFQEIQETLLRASKMQMEKGRRSREKADLTHDAKIYHLINSLRGKRNSGELSLGYDTYLLTLDGSLVHFTKIYGIPWTETYFIYPNQWYELAFPFLRLRTSENPGFAAGLASLVFSSAFPTLLSLIPLELCAYVFDLGGTDLPMGSIRNVAEWLVEERLVESLDPANEDRRKREEAKLRVQRMIAEEEQKQKKTIQELERKAEALRREAESLREERHLLGTDVEELTTAKKDLAAEITKRKADIEKYGGFEAKVESIRSEYEEQLAELGAKHATELQDKDRELAARDERLAKVENKVGSIEQMLRENQEEKEKAKQQRAKQMLDLKKFIVTALMLFGLLLGPALLIQFGIETWMVLVSIFFMGLGLALYHWLASSLWAFGVYGLGMLVAGGMILIKNGLEAWQWIIPMAWEILVFVIDRRIGKQTPE